MSSIQGANVNKFKSAAAIKQTKAPSVKPQQKTNAHPPVQLGNLQQSQPLKPGQGQALSLIG